MQDIHPPKFIILKIRKNSLRRFKLGGADALPTHKINQKKQNIGDKEINPRFKNIFRVPLFSYKHWTPKNKPEEHKPCDIRIPIIPFIPIKSQEKQAANIKDMCATDEYATKDFKSHWRKHIKPTKHILTIAHINNKFLHEHNRISKKCKERTKPYAPNFNNIPASTIDPATGASTCAFGSHKWTP